MNITSMPESIAIGHIYPSCSLLETPNPEHRSTDQQKAIFINFLHQEENPLPLFLPSCFSAVLFSNPCIFKIFYPKGIIYDILYIQLAQPSISMKKIGIMTISYQYSFCLMKSNMHFDCRKRQCVSMHHKSVAIPYH